MEILYLSQQDILGLDMGLTGVIRVVEAAPREQGEGQVAMPVEPQRRPLLATGANLFGRQAGRNWRIRG